MDARDEISKKAEQMQATERSKSANWVAINELPAAYVHPDMQNLT
jgi:hypothetical protein